MRCAVIRNWFRSGLLGMGALLAVNTAGAFTGVTLGYSYLTTAVSFVLGIPGVALLTVLDGIFRYF